MPDARALVTLVRRAVLFEVRLYVSLLRWVTRRKAVKGAGVQPFGYARAVTPVMWLWIFASAAEIPLVHLLIPWETVRIVALLLSIWGLVWMVGFLASLNVYPHLADEKALRIRHGASLDITVPWQSIHIATVARRDLASSMRTLQPRETDRGTDLQVAVSGEVNVHLAFHEPMTVKTPKGPMEIAELSFLADEPRAVVDRVRQAVSCST